MDKKLKAKWVKALRSGKYRQADGVLRSKNGAYCCLGVLRAIMHPGSRKAREDEELLCIEHQKEAGITYRTQEKLAGMNDEGHSFDDIADYIQKRL